VYGNGLLKPLKASGGLIWPYTPTIQYNHPIDYQTIQTVHSNQDFHIYAKTPAVSLQVSGEFTVQNQLEGSYAMAAIHFLRTMAKMNFGQNDPDAGTPPPVLLFNAYGPFVFKDLPVIVKDFNVEFPADVDYVQVAVAGTKTSTETTPSRTVDTLITREPLAPLPAIPGTTGPTGEGVGSADANYNANLPARTWGQQGTIPGITSISTAPQSYTVWLPAVFKIGCTLIVQHTSKELREDFDLKRYRDGDDSQKRWI
jgi:hypothetical protein